MLHHTQAVGRGFKKPLNQQPLVICDLPFLSYQCGEDKAVAAAGSLLKNSCAAAVKIEVADSVGDNSMHARVPRCEPFSLI